VRKDRITQSLCASLLLVVALAGCEGQRWGARETGALGGAALGAGLGAIIGNQVGSPGAGIAIGSAFGALGGGLIGNELDGQNTNLDSQELLLEEQEQQLQENKRLLESLKRQGTDARITKRGVVVNLPDVLFEFDSATLTPSASGTVADVARAVNVNGERSVSVEGHTDSLGTEEYNQRLSLNRARSVTAELVAQGVKRARITTRGLGEASPVASNHSAAGRSKNRRVEVVIEN
jgi:outer membrane protein OmpA-like peptidoglycan-associated protein